MDKTIPSTDLARVGRRSCSWRVPSPRGLASTLRAAISPDAHRRLTSLKALQIKSVAGAISGTVGRLPTKWMSSSSQMVVTPVADPLILAAAASGVERAIAATGVNSHRVLELGGVDPARIADPSLRLDLKDYCRLFDVAARETGDDF